MTSDLTPDQKAELDKLAFMPDADIDTSDIPETKEFPNPQRGVFSGGPNRSKSEIAAENQRQPFEHGGLARETDAKREGRCR